VGALLLLGGLAFVAAVAGVVWVVENRPSWVARGVERAVGWPEHALEIGAIDLRWGGRFLVHDLRVQPPGPNAPQVTLRRAEADLPDPVALWERVDVSLGDVLLDELAIVRPNQAPARGLELPPGPWPVSLVGDRVTVTDASFEAPKDGILSAVSVTGIDLDAVDVRWTPAVRQIEALGAARIDQLQLGAIPLHTLRVPSLVVDKTVVALPSAHVEYGTSTVAVSGDITDLDTRAAVLLDVLVEKERVETAVSTALGGRSPLRGFLQARVRLRSGGDLPRGGARFEGFLRLRSAEVFVGNDLKMLPKVLIDIAPWFRRQESGWLEAGNLIGEGAFGRGWVRLQMERPSRKHRVLQAWGQIDGSAMDLVVRAVPKKGADRPGIGVSVKGSVHAPRLKLAERDVLRQAPPLLSAQ